MLHQIITRAPAPSTNPFARIADYAAARGIPTHIDTVEIEMTGHADCGAIIWAEVEFIEADADGDREIVAVRPFERKYVNGHVSTDRDYIDAPVWLIRSLAVCVDTGCLRAAE